MREPLWVRLEDALAIHNRQLAEHSGASGVRDRGLLESALDKPKNPFAYGNPELVEMAASYAYGIARNHPFIDGNKRTAYTVSRFFLKLNGRDFIATKDEKYLTFLALGEGRLSEAELAAWFAANGATA